MLKTHTWILVGVAALCAALGGFWVARELASSAPQLASGTWLPNPRPIGQFAVIDQRGHPFTAGDLLGKPSLVFFGFTHCPEVCPTTLAKLAQVKKAAAVSGLQVVFITVDPQRDTPRTMDLYVRNFDPTFIGLTGDPKTIVALAGRFGVAVSRIDLPDGDYMMDHSAAVFLLDNAARISAIFTPPFDTTHFAQDLRTAAPYLRSSS